MVERINWGYFFAAWGMPGKYPDIFSHPERGEEARRLYADAQSMLKKIADEGLLELRSVVQTFPAMAKGDDVEITLPDGTTRTLPFIRSSSGECVADFIGDSITLFALSAGFGVAQLYKKYNDEYDYYSAFMVKFLADRLTEAYAETLLPGGCRIAFGYPAAPDHTLKRDVFEILDVEARTGMTLTESCMIVPGESICGVWMPRGHYFSVGQLTPEQIEAYAQRRPHPLSTIQAQFK